MATCRKISKERMALKISLAGTIFVASLGIGYGLYVGSNAIYLIINQLTLVTIAVSVIQVALTISFIILPHTLV